MLFNKKLILKIKKLPKKSKKTQKKLGYWNLMRGNITGQKKLKSIKSSLKRKKKNLEIKEKWVFRFDYGGKKKKNKDILIKNEDIWKHKKRK